MFSTRLFLAAFLITTVSLTTEAKTPKPTTTTTPKPPTTTVPPPTTTTTPPPTTTTQPVGIKPVDIKVNGLSLGGSYKSNEDYIWQEQSAISMMDINGPYFINNIRTTTTKSAVQAYQECRSLFPGTGQLRAANSSPSYSLFWANSAADRFWTASMTFTCSSGSYIGWIASNQLGAAEIFLSQTKTVGGTVCLTENAASSVVIALEGNSSVSVPASVTIPAGQRCANYTATAVGYATGMIKAKLNGFWSVVRLDIWP